MKKGAFLHFRDLRFKVFSLEAWLSMFTSRANNSLELSDVVQTLEQYRGNCSLRLIGLVSFSVW